MSDWIVEDSWDWWPQTSCRRRTLRKDELLFHRGDRVTAMFRVERGAVRLERRTIDGRLLILHTAQAGGMIAEASLFSDAYHCDASAAEDAVVRACPKADLLTAMSADPRKALQFSRLVARQLQALRQQIELRNVRSAADRILLYLELKADPVTREFHLQGTLQDVAAELGLTREAFYRALSRLERGGAVRRRDRTIIF